MELKYSEKTLDITAYVVVAMSIVLFVVLLILPKVKSNHSKKEKVMDSTVYKTEQESNTEEEITANDVEYPEEEIINELDITIDDISEANIKEIETIANKELEEDIDYYKCMTDGTASVAGVYVLTNDAKDKNIVYALINRNITFYDLPLSYYNFLMFNDVEKVNDQIDFTEQSYVQTNSLGKDGTFMASNENGERELAGYETVESFEEQIIEPLLETYNIDEKYIDSDIEDVTAPIESEEIENDYFYEKGFDKLEKIETGKEYETVVDYFNKDPYSNTISFDRTSISKMMISDYCRTSGDDKHTSKDGYEWCKFVLTLRAESDYDEVLLNAVLCDCTQDILSPHWQHRKNDDGFLEFDIPYNGKVYTGMFEQKTHKEGKIEKNEIWIRVPEGYTGIVFLYDMQSPNKYIEEHNGEPASYGSDLIIENTKYFRLDEIDKQETYTNSISEDKLSGDYYQEFESNAYYHIEKKSDDIWTWDTVYIDTGKVVEGFPTQEFILKEEGVWECITPSHEGYTIQKIGDDRILVTEEFEYFELVKR